jgi:hypothetical protein
MKKLYVLLLVAAFLFVGAQAFASPPVKAPPELDWISSTTTIDCGAPGWPAPCTFVEYEQYNWTYFEGWGGGPFFPVGYTPAGCVKNCGTTPCAGLYSELGFTAGAEIAYQQRFKAVNAIVGSHFHKTFNAWGWSDASHDNLEVNKDITYEGTDPQKDRATHEEKVGLSVISMGGFPISAATSISGLLSLCPWSAQTPGTPGGAYPPTNEGIAAGSSFKVSKITNFLSKSKVNSTANPMLSYNVEAPSGTGFIDAGFVVELFEGPAGTVWAPLPITGTCFTCINVTCDPRAGTVCYQNAPTPPLASRTSYKEYASADGTWVFQKHVKYESRMPAGAAAGTFPINTVLQP